MRKLTGMDQRLRSTANTDETTLPTFKEILRMVGNTKAKNADDARRIRRVISTINQANGEVDLADEDFKILKTAVEDNAISLTSWAQGSILEWLDSLDK